MLTVAHPLALVLVVLAASMLPALASDRADKPPLRSALPSHVEAPRDPHEKTRVSAPPRAAEKTRAAAHDKVNINAADVKTLMTLAGVGRKVAEKIVEYRDSRGPFKNAEQIRKVEGVGTGVWEKNRARIVVK